MSTSSQLTDRIQRDDLISQQDDEPAPHEVAQNAIATGTAASTNSVTSSLAANSGGVAANEPPQRLGVAQSQLNRGMFLSYAYA